MISLAEAQQAILAVTPFNSLISLPLVEASGYVLGQDIESKNPLPAFDNSAMDGYALHWEPEQVAPFYVTVIEHIAAGYVSKQILAVGQAVKIMTGAPVPSSANTVVPIENTRQIDEKTIEVLETPSLGRHIRCAGEEVQSGQKVLAKGQVLNIGSVGLLASLGFQEIPVYKPPLVGIVATGSELVPVDQALEPGKIRDSNSHILATCVAQAGAIPVMFGIAPDDKEQLKDVLNEAFKACDIVLTSGGVSVGDHDYVQEVLIELGLEKKFWKVAIKPGKPLLFGLLNDRLCFGVPGNPASAIVVFEYLIRPALRQMMGYAQLWRPQVQARLTASVKPAQGRLHLMRVCLDLGGSGYEVHPLRAQGSSNLLTMTQANAILPVHAAYQSGEMVTVDCIEQKENH